MRVILFGATGMVGQGVLRQCLLDPEVERVLVITRAATEQKHDKLRELVQADLFDLTSIESELWGYDTCFWCLGISSVGMTEEAYQRVTHDLTVAAAKVLIARNPQMTFLFVSGGGTDSTEQGRTMWARIKGKTENALLAMPFPAKYMFRPGFIQPMHGAVSRDRMLRFFYRLSSPLYPLWKRLFPKYVTTTETLARAMIQAARQGAPKKVLENTDINALVG